MALDSYGVQNLSYLDDTKTDEYLLTKVDTKSSTFNIPLNMEETGFMYASELTSIICTEPVDKVKNFIADDNIKESEVKD